MKPYLILVRQIDNGDVIMTRKDLEDIIDVAYEQGIKDGEINGSEIRNNYTHWMPDGMH